MIFNERFLKGVARFGLGMFVGGSVSAMVASVAGFSVGVPLATMLIGLIIAYCCYSILE